MRLFPVDETHRQESCIGPEGESTPPPQEVAGVYHFKEGMQESLHLAIGGAQWRHKASPAGELVLDSLDRMMR